MGFTENQSRKELIELTDKSMNTVIEISSIPANRILDSGKANIVK